MLIDLVFGSAHISVRIFVTPLFMGKFRFLPARSLFAYFFPSRTRTKLCTFRPLMLMAAGFESSQAEDQRNLELGMSGMNLMPSNGGGHISPSQAETNGKNSGNGLTTPVSPLGASKGMGRGSFGKSGHSKSSSVSTSQSITLTPTSSLDGASSELYGMAPLQGDGTDLPSRITTMPLNAAFAPSRGPSSSRPPLAGSGYLHDSGDLRAPGVISRPGYGLGDTDGHLRRSTSTDTGRESLLNSYPNAAQGQQAIDQQRLFQKFGSLPNLGSHVNQQRLNPNQQPFQPGNQFQPMPLQRHQRSVSQGGMTSHQQHSPYLAAATEGANLYRRNSLQLPPNGSGYYGQAGPIIASKEDMRMFSNSEYERGGQSGFPGHERIVSPGVSPLQTHYGSHSRQVSDNSSTSMGNMRIAGQPQSMYGANLKNGHHRPQPVDEDLSHPLVGENIAVEADDHPYLMNDGATTQHAVRSASGRSGSIDGAPAQYGKQVEGAHHLATAGSALPMPKSVYSVKFKRTQRSFVIGPRLNRDLKIGTYVKVEADRGEDLGIVVGKVAPEKQGRSDFRGAMSAPGGTADLKRIIRLATHDEVSLLSMKRDEEEELLKICRGKVRQRSLPMNVVDAEYQFDRHKLTFFFEAEGRVDFRELVRDLFSMYKTRIWMQQLDKNTSGACHAVVAPPTPVAIDYGTPIIAPVSEFKEFVTDGNIETD